MSWRTQNKPSSPLFVMGSDVPSPEYMAGIHTHIIRCYSMVNAEGLFAQTSSEQHNS